MPYMRFAILAMIATVLITVALANRDVVTLRLLPEGLAELVRYPEASNTISLPLFLVILASLVGGILLGFVWEWLREHKYRAEAVRRRRENDRLARKVAAIRQDDGQGDDVLAILEDAGSAR